MAIKKDDVIHIKINSEDKEQISLAAEQLDIPVSQFIREAAREKIAQINERSKELPTATAAVN